MPGHSNDYGTPAESTARQADDDLESHVDPGSLRAVDGVEYREDTRAFEDEKYEGLRRRYEAIDGVVMVGVVDDGAVLLEGHDQWYPPGGEVDPGEDWAATARRSVEAMTGVDVAIDAAVRVERTYFHLEGDEDERFPADSVLFRASLAEQAPEFRSDPTLAEGFEHPFAERDEIRLGWFESVPEEANPNHVDHIRPFLDGEVER